MKNSLHFWREVEGYKRFHFTPKWLGRPGDIDPVPFTMFEWVGDWKPMGLSNEMVDHAHISNNAWGIHMRVGRFNPHDLELLYDKFPNPEDLMVCSDTYLQFLAGFHYPEGVINLRDKLNREQGFTLLQSHFEGSDWWQLYMPFKRIMSGRSIGDFHRFAPHIKPTPANIALLPEGHFFEDTIFTFKERMALMGIRKDLAIIGGVLPEFQEMVSGERGAKEVVVEKSVVEVDEEKWDMAEEFDCLRSRLRVPHVGVDELFEEVVGKGMATRKNKEKFERQLGMTISEYQDKHGFKVKPPLKF